MYLMPTHSKHRVTNVGLMSNANYHIAKIVPPDDEIRPLCGSENVEGPIQPLDVADIPIGICQRCKQLAKLP